MKWEPRNSYYVLHLEYETKFHTRRKRAKIIVLYLILGFTARHLQHKTIYKMYAYRISCAAFTTILPLIFSNGTNDVIVSCLGIHHAEFTGLRIPTQSFPTAETCRTFICKRPVCYYDIIDYLLTFNTLFDFQVFSILGYSDMFRY
jgi:hypothetical protein